MSTTNMLGTFAVFSDESGNVLGAPKFLTPDIKGPLISLPIAQDVARPDAVNAQIVWAQVRQGRGPRTPEGTLHSISPVTPLGR